MHYGRLWLTHPEAYGRTFLDNHKIRCFLNYFFSSEVQLSHPSSLLPTSYVNGNVNLDS